MLDEQSKALPQFDGLPYGNQPPTRTTRTTTPQTFLELEVHLKRYQVHLYSDTSTPLSLLNSRVHHYCLSIKPGSMSFWHIFVISPHFEKKTVSFPFFSSRKWLDLCVWYRTRAAIHRTRAAIHPFGLKIAVQRRFDLLITRICVLRPNSLWFVKYAQLSEFYFYSQTGSYNNDKCRATKSYL